ncbi:hypothetical protein UVI_02058540 [Ustilaginoidea virens]|uniref:WW domain-containing protein n=1 Tax=Ustilaginoidea virens TaxID=1159556 RepID=A0A1B5L2I7_USTVR|nr:hypothetical protein UVI_02058540 [Ustilaginoidea virens]
MGCALERTIQGVTVAKESAVPRCRFYVNVYTKKSQWDKPTEPVFPVDDNAPSDPPPGYEPGKNAPVTADVKKDPYQDRTDDKSGLPAAAHALTSAPDQDAQLAAKLQAEEDAKARGGPAPPAGHGNPGGGAADSYTQGYQGNQSQQQYPSELPPRADSARGKDRGFLGKLFGKGKNTQQEQSSYGGGYPQQQQQQQGYYQSPPPQQYGGYPQQGSPMGGGYGGGYGGYGGGYAPGPYPQAGYHQQQQQQPARKSGMGGMGMGLAGGALGLGAGVLGGALIADAIHDHDQAEYMQGYEAGQDNAYDDDFGGGDFGGGDF